MARAKNDELRQKILHTAYQMFLEQGYSQVSLKEISVACEISPSLLQHYFPKKDDILVHIIYNMFHQIMGMVHQTFREEFESNPRYAPALQDALFYVLGYSVFTRNNDQLLKLYANSLFSAESLKSGFDLTLNPFPYVVGEENEEGYRFRNAMIEAGYTIIGCLSQFVTRYLARKSSMDMEQLVYRALDIGFYDCGIKEKDRKQILNRTRQLATPEAKEKCYALVQESTNHFVPCPW